MLLKDSEIWDKVIELEGEELFTYVNNNKNTITSINNSQVIIDERITYPVKEDIIDAYKLLIKQGKLKRNPDLLWLSHPEKKVSSIIFRIVGEISKSHTIIDFSRKEPVLILKK